MATYTYRSGAWFAQVRRKGHKSISRTFDTKAQAERWALQVEASMGVGTYVDTRETLSVTLGDCLERYAREVSDGKKGVVRELQRVRFLLRDPLANKAIGTIKQVDLARWRDARAAVVSGSTVAKDLALISHVFTIAIKEWGYPLVNPVAAIRKPRQNKARERRLSPGEEELLLSGAGAELRVFIVLAIETGMRRGELAALRREWVSGRVVRLPDTKNGDARAVPLSSRALGALSSLPIRIDGRFFGFKPDAYSHQFARLCRDVGISGLCLHDLRHEATSRFFERGLDVMQVKSITGHKTLAMLARYTHLRAEELADKLG